MAFTNSPLVSKTKISPNRTKNRNHEIDTITIHCYVGQVTVDRGLDGFAKSSRQASCNYVIDKDGKIGLCVEEKDRSWCTSNATNDHRAITIEVASDSNHPYAVNNAAYTSLIDLCADICKRNGIKKLVWSTNKDERVNHKNGCNLTVHRDYAAKACPGDWLYNKMPQTAEKVNKLISADTKPLLNAFYTVSTVKGAWLPKVKNYDGTAAGYAGVPNRAIDKIAINITGGCRYRVAPIGKGYLPWVTGYNQEDDNNGYAGLDDVPFDRLQIDAKKGKAVYRVRVKGDKNYQPWVTSYNLINANGYAGIKGKQIDAIQIYVKE